MSPTAAAAAVDPASAVDGRAGWINITGNVGGDQVYRSDDGGKTWQPLGPKLPYKVNGVAYSTGLRCIIAWRSTEKKVPDAIVRWDLPEASGK